MRYRLTSRTKQKLVYVLGIALISTVGLLSEQHLVSQPIQKIQRVEQYSPSEEDVLPKQQPLEFQNNKQFVMKDLDSLGRAVDSHIQLKLSDTPKASGKSRANKINYDPVGWHNYKFNGNWLFDRGHLVGYQFSGVNDEVKNLVPMTHLLNAGKESSGMNDSDDQSMLFYENRLYQWLEANPDKYLDYQVTPIYKGNDLLPKQIRLSYIGFNPDGSKVQIDLGSQVQQISENGTVVVLNNTSPNVNIDYLLGTATQITYSHKD